ncbi:SMI1/KNR4 family protein [Ohtaekwangia sp.]|uniref:SMI1/KNR4 family protein n=1 Tax=Ohtaekwangia sp. TaxID=2066019 RepID=UPI002FDD9ABC
MKNLNVVYTFQKLSKEEIENIQKEIDVAFPKNYVDFILMYNGGRFNETVYKLPHEDVVICDFLPVLDSNSNRTIKDYLALVNDEQPQINWLPFGFDPGGWVFCISLLKDKYGEVYLFRMDRVYQEAFDFICKSFEDFINGLQPEE